MGIASAVALGARAAAVAPPILRAALWPPVHAGGFFSAVSQPNRFAKVRDSGVTIYRRRIHVRLQLTCGRDTSR
jgi:hypothetical protein